MPICTTDYLLADEAFTGSHPHFLIFLLPLMEFHGVLSTHFQGTSSISIHLPYPHVLIVNGYNVLEYNKWEL